MLFTCKPGVRSQIGRWLVQVVSQQTRRMCRTCLYGAQYARIAQAIRTERLIVEGDRVLLALSGGAAPVPSITHNLLPSRCGAHVQDVGYSLLCMGRMLSFMS